MINQGQVPWPLAGSCLGGKALGRREEEVLGQIREDATSPSGGPHGPSQREVGRRQASSAALRSGRGGSVDAKGGHEDATKHVADNAVALSPAYVLKLGPNGLTVVRALGRRGIPVVSLHTERGDPAARSRYTRSRILPPIEEHEDAWIDALLEEARRLGLSPGVIFPISDASWLFLVRHRHALSRSFRFALPEADNLAGWPGKPFQYRAAAEAGVPFPRTVLPRSENEARDAAAALGFPCVIKPVYSHLRPATYGWEKLAFVTTPEELVVKWRDASQHRLALMLQEYVPGGDDQIYSVHSYLDSRSRPLAAGVLRKIRQYPPRFGAGCCAVSIVDPAITQPIKDMGLALLQTVGFHGISGVEFKRDARTGDFKLIEMNVRTGTMTAVIVDSGLNLPFIAYCDLLGQPAPAPVPLRAGRKVVIIDRDIKSFRYYKARGELTWLQWVRSLIGRTREYYFGWDDPAPFLGRLGGLVRRAVR